MSHQLLPPLADQWVREINSDTYSGAAALTRKTLEAFEDVVRGIATESLQTQWDCLNEMGTQLIASHPDMAPIRHCVQYLLESLSPHVKGTLSPSEFVEKALKASSEYSCLLDQSSEDVVEKGVAVLQNAKRVLTISSSSTIKAVITVAWARQAKFDVYVAESLPGGEGKLFAEELGERAASISDMHAVQYMKECDAVVVGADILTETHFVNKAGTYLLALAAKELNIPFYLITESHKKIQEALPDFRKDSPFEAVPLHLVTEVITDTVW